MVYKTKTEEDAAKPLLDVEEKIGLDTDDVNDKDTQVALPSSYYEYRRLRIARKIVTQLVNFFSFIYVSWSCSVFINLFDMVESNEANVVTLSHLWMGLYGPYVFLLVLSTYLQVRYQKKTGIVFMKSTVKNRKYLIIITVCIFVAILSNLGALVYCLYKENNVGVRYALGALGLVSVGCAIGLIYSAFSTDIGVQIVATIPGKLQFARKFHRRLRFINLLFMAVGLFLLSGLCFEYFMYGQETDRIDLLIRVFFETMILSYFVSYIGSCVLIHVAP